MTSHRAKQILKELHEQGITNFISPGGSSNPDMPHSEWIQDCYERWSTKLNRIIHPCEIAYLDGILNSFSYFKIDFPRKPTMLDII